MNFSYRIDDVTKFKHLSQFRDVKDFNNNIEMFLADHKDKFTKSELIGFKRLVRLSVKVPGVSTASKRYILNAINEKENGYGISESTFDRMKRKAIKLGALSIETTERSDGSQSSNVWVFNRVVGESNINDTPDEKNKGREVATIREKVAKRLTPLKTSIHFKTSKNINNTYKNLDATFVYDPKLNGLIEVIKPFYNDYATVKEYVKATKQNTRKYKAVTGYDYVDNATRNEIDSDIQTMAIRSFKRTVAAIRDRKNTRKAINNPIGLFVKILRETTRETFLLS